MVTIMSENFAPMRTGTYPRKATMTRILIVEDEESYREPLVYQLTREGYDVSAAATGEEGLELFTKGGIDLVLLDLMLPGIDGTALCRRIREQSRVPIIMLTAKSAEIDKVVGLEIGADDYVTKPYSFRELLARIRAVMRRNQATAQASGTVDDDIPLVCGDIAMQVGQHQVTVRGETVFFPLKEFELLEYLMQNKGRVMTRHQLIDRIWGSDYVGDTKTLDVHVKRVRSKIEEDPAHPKYLTTVRGLGYKIDGKLNIGSKVNLERALSIQSRLGGHIVSGHIDGTGKIISFVKEDNAIWVTVDASTDILKYVVHKGSITIDGISLTVAYVDDSCFKVSIIPHTASETTLISKKIGDTVNLECDLIGKYLKKLL